jgi:dihydroxy-acid dehydratase
MVISYRKKCLGPAALSIQEDCAASADSAGVSGLRRGLTDYGDAEFAWYLRRSFAKAAGYSSAALERPTVGIASSRSDLNPCHRTMPELVEAVKRGVLAAGGLPLEFPTISLGEVFLHPTSMMYRNLMAMDAEEMLRAQPLDAAVLIGGCDKTLPALLMGAASADVPVLALPVGPMMTGHFQGERLGACTDCRRFWGRFRAGEIDRATIDAVEENLATTAGTCAVMGTASTMAILAETLGVTLRDAAAYPAVHAGRLRVAEASGAAAVALAKERRTLRDVLVPGAIENALRVLLACGGSTNALIHLTAIAGRVGISIDMSRFNEIAAETPVIVDCKPVGAHYMEDVAAAGGVSAILRELRSQLKLDVIGVDGRTLGERLDAAPSYVDHTVIRPFDAPYSANGGLIAVSGSLAPRGALVKVAAADPRLMQHEGRAVVFDDLRDLARRIDDPGLDVLPDDVLVLKNAGPVAAGMPEAGYLPIPMKLARAGVRDMLRISDARMSGTAYGAVVLHVTPEAATGGPLAAVRNGDRIRLDVDGRRIDLLLEEGEIQRRLAAHRPPALPERGYARLFAESVLGADLGCDFSFLRPALR